MNFFQIAVRVAHKLKLASGSMGEGWWITPEGKVIDVPSGQLHEEVATEILKERDPEKIFSEDEMAQDAFLDLGATRIRIYKNFFVVSVKRLTSKILDQVTDLMIDQDVSKNFKVIVEETSSGKKVTLPVNEFLNFTNPTALFKAVASKIRKIASYRGSWITPDGDVINNPSGIGHAETVLPILESLGVDASKSDYPPDLYQEMGAIRMRNYGNQAAIDVYKLTNTLLNRIINYLMSESFPTDSIVTISEGTFFGSHKYNIAKFSELLDMKSPSEFWTFKSEAKDPNSEHQNRSVASKRRKF